MFIRVLTLISFIAIACDYNFYEDENGDCQACSSECNDCDGPGETGCIACGGTYAMMEGICISECPLGFQKDSSVCQSYTSSGIALDLDLSKISNNVDDLASPDGGEREISCGETNSYYPTYESSDPYAIKNRGFYFNEASYFKTDDFDITFGPVFTVGMWLKSEQTSSYVLQKRSSTTEYLSLSLSDSKPKFLLYLGSAAESYTSSLTIANSEWNFLMIKVTMQDFQAVITLYVNQDSESSSVLSTYYADLYTDFDLTLIFSKGIYGILYTTTTNNL